MIYNLTGKDIEYNGKIYPYYKEPFNVKWKVEYNYRINECHLIVERLEIYIIEGLFVQSNDFVIVNKEECVYYTKYFNYNSVFYFENGKFYNLDHLIDWSGGDS